MIAVLAGGVGAAKLLAGLVDVVDPRDITAIVNTGDDTVLHGLHISPDIDTVTYTLGGIANAETGWGVADETWAVMTELAALGGQTWFRLGDRDMATHLYRTQRLSEGATLSQVTGEIAAARGIAVHLVPMSDERVATRVTLASDSREVGFQEWFVGMGHAEPVRSVRFDGIRKARPAPEVLASLRSAERIVIAPSNPIVSIGPILAVPRVAPAVAARRGDVVAISPIVAGKALKGPADRLMSELGHDPSVVGVARLYAPYAGTLVVDTADASRASAVEAEGLRCIVTPTIMRDRAAAAALAKTVIS